VSEKAWNITATLRPGAAVALSAEEGPWIDSAAWGQAAASPVEYFLAAVATCLAQSYRIVMEARNMPEIPLDVWVKGSRAVDKPNRISALDVVVTFSADIDVRLSKRLTADVKRICTITNTIGRAMSVEPRLEYDCE